MPTAAAEGRAHAHLVHLLDLDPDLGEGLPEDARREARARVVAAVVELAAGDFDPAEVVAVGRGGFAVLVTQGVVIRELDLAGTPSAALLGPGDLLPRNRSADGILAVGERWHVSSDATVAVLDDRLDPALHRWPSIGRCLVVRAARQAARAAEHRAIAQLPRVELRLRALLWHLADQWGRMGAGGVVVPVELTHEALGRLVGARRPTVTLALGELMRDGLVARRADGAWLLPHGTNPAPEAAAPGHAPADAALIAVPEPPLARVADRPAGVSPRDLDALSIRVRRQLEAAAEQATLTRGLLRRSRAAQVQARATRARVRPPRGPRR